MNSTVRYDIITLLNKSVWDDSAKKVADLLNDLFSSNNYKEYLDLIFYAISNFQLYGFVEYLTEEEKQCFIEMDVYRSNSYRGREIEFYNKGQLSFLYEIEKNQKILFSAPTSFGKTSIISEFIIQNHKRLQNIVFVVPTNSLLEELYVKFLAYNKQFVMGFNVTNQPDKMIGKNIFLLTPERFLIFIQSINMKDVDLLIMDEMYKIADSQKRKITDFVNNRSLRFRKVADIIASSENKVVFLSPFTYTSTRSMSRFLQKYNIKKVNRRVEYVKRKIINAEEFMDKGKKTNYAKTIDILKMLFGQKNIVYVSGYNDGYKIVDAYNEDFKCDDERYIAFCNHIKQNYIIDEKAWSIADAIYKGIGMYIAPMPRYIKKELVSLYEKGIINTLIVTTAFTEGVNTSAKNLIFTSIQNGGHANDLTDIDILNVMGRVGRFAKESVGNIYCINEKIYKKVCELQNNGDCQLENLNYEENKQKIDYEIEMMDERFLSEDEKNKRNETLIEMQQFDISLHDFHISLNVSNQWKLWLYKFFDSLNEEQLYVRYNQLQIISKNDNGIYEDALSIIFKDIRRALEDNGVKAFPVQVYEIPAFDKKGEFIWARLYKYYANGNIKTTISNNIRYITGRFNKVVQGKQYKKKSDLQRLFEEEGCAWILAYYTNKLEVNYNKFYSECFRFISNVVQYKIPFYLTFYMSIYKLFLRKQNIQKLELDKLQEKDVMILFEDGGISNEYKRLLDYGIPMITINKIKENNIDEKDLMDKYEQLEELDKYEKMILRDCLEVI